MLSMPAPSSTGSSISRLSLLAVADANKHRSPDAPKIRRYRLARVAQSRPSGDAVSRLKHVS